MLFGPYVLEPWGKVKWVQESLKVVWNQVAAGLGRSRLRLSRRNATSCVSNSFSSGIVRTDAIPFEQQLVAALSVESDT